MHLTDLTFYLDNTNDIISTYILLDNNMNTLSVVVMGMKNVYKKERVEKAEEKLNNQTLMSETKNRQLQQDSNSQHPTKIPKE